MWPFGNVKKEAVFNPPTNGGIVPMCQSDAEFKAVAENFVSLLSSGGVNWAHNKYLLDFLEVPELNAVIQIKAKAFSNMNLQVVSKATGTPISNYENAVKVLRSPNYYQTQKEFLISTKINREVFGNEIINVLRPVGMPNSYKGIFSITPSLVEIEIPLTTQAPWQVYELDSTVKYYSTWNGQRSELNKDNLIHINDAPNKQQSDKWLWGTSKIASLQPNIQNIRAAYDSRNVMIKNRGALGILSNGAVDAMGSTIPHDAKEVDKLQKAARKYGVTQEQYQFIITNLNLKWQQMAIDMDKLKLFEECEEDRMRICDAYGVPPELLASPKGTTYENRKQANIDLYQNAIIPESLEWIGALNNFFDTENKSWVIVGSYDHLPVMQENLKERGNALVLVTNALSKAYQDGAISLPQYQSELKKYGI